MLSCTNIEWVVHMKICTNENYPLTVPKGGSDGNHLNKVLAAQVDKLITADRQNNESPDSVWNTIPKTPSQRPSPVTIFDTVFAVGAWTN